MIGKSALSRLTTTLAVALIFGFACTDRLEKPTIQIGEHTFVVEIARAPEDQQLGLMFREDLADNAGMLFYYQRDRRMYFWMKNTSIPLTIAFISSDGIIREIYDMTPQSLRTVSSQRSLRDALEVNQGALERRGILPGDRVEFPADFQ